MAKRFLFLLWFSFVLASCRIGNSVIAISTLTPIPTLSPTTTSTVTVTPTQTGTPTISPEVMRYQCLQIDDQRRADVQLKGVIVTNDERNEYAFLWNNETNEPYMFPREEADRLFGFEVSLDGKHILYIHYSVSTKEDRLVIATADGQPIWSKVISGYAWQWFDNERLINLEFSDDGKHTLSLLNPLTGETQPLQSDFLDPALFNGEWYSNWSILNSYDPTLTRVIYPEIGSHAKQEYPIILWDNEADQVVTRLMTLDAWGGTPLWTPDGKQVVIATSTHLGQLERIEFFVISRDGVVKQLTHFADYFEKIDILNNYRLSPNGKLVAFWIEARPSLYDGRQLAVLNLETGEVVNYCIKGDPFADNAMGPSEPIWSPDSTQLLVISRIPEDTKVRRVIMVDIANNYAAQIDADMEPVGWMVTP